jgi:prolyl oligopeptidase
MHTVMPPPFSSIEPVTDVLHGVRVTDPYRWLEDQNSPKTRAWIEKQTRYARGYLDNIPGRDRIRERVRDLLDVETYDSFLKSGNRYFFRKRLSGEEQPSIYLREGPHGRDELLINPSSRATGKYTAVKPLRVSWDGSLLLYQIKQGGERMATFEILDVRNRRILPDTLSHGYLRGFAFAANSRSFYYVHESSAAGGQCCCAVYEHALGTPFAQDEQIFRTDEPGSLRVALVSGPRQLGVMVYRFLEKTLTDFYLLGMYGARKPVPILRRASHFFAPRFVEGRILAETDRDAPNRRIVEVQARYHQEPLFFEVVPERDTPITLWAVTANYVVATYSQSTTTDVRVFDLHGSRTGQIPCNAGETVRVVGHNRDDDEILLERQSFTKPIEVERYSLATATSTPWSRTDVCLDPAIYVHTADRFASKDATKIPISLLSRRDVLSRRPRPAILTSYGGFGVPVSPQFSVLVTFLVAQGCLFALPNIRGGGEFGVAWHNAAKRRNRQVAFDDFLSAAEWLIATGQTTPELLAVFGGSNSGLLVAAALTQRPELFRSVLCLVPLTDMLRYHLFDNAHVWREEFGTTEDPEDFEALARYSPYQRIHDSVLYPATMIVSGDADQTCNPLHARKMTARLQAVNASNHPVILDYSEFRGHSPVLPLTTRIEALTDRLAFLCDQLGLRV